MRAGCERWGEKVEMADGRVEHRNGRVVALTVTILRLTARTERTEADEDGEEESVVKVGKTVEACEGFDRGRQVAAAGPKYLEAAARPNIG